jgi:transposase
VSRRRVAEIFRDVLSITIALGTISNLEQEAADALEEPYEEAAAEVRKDRPKNVDETGWKEQGRKRWLWVAATATVAFFVISTRGAVGLTALLGEKLLGIFTTDRWGVYNARTTRFRQLCWSHLLRDFQKLVDRGGGAARIGKRAKEIGGFLFLLWRDFKAGDIDRETLRKCLQPLRRELKELLQQGTRLRDAKSATFCANLLDLEPALWTFARCEGVEPTNNHGERMLRTGVLWRKRSFGSRSDNGRRFVERILTAVQSRRLQKRPVFSFLVEAVSAHRAGRPAPSILPT